MSKIKTIRTKVNTTCAACGGRGIVPHRHITNKRNSKPCLPCEQTGEVSVIMDVPVN